MTSQENSSFFARPSVLKSATISNIEADWRSRPSWPRQSTKYSNFRSCSTLFAHGVTKNWFHLTLGTLTTVWSMWPKGIHSLQLKLGLAIENRKRNVKWYQILDIYWPVDLLLIPCKFTHVKNAEPLELFGQPRGTVSLEEESSLDVEHGVQVVEQQGLLLGAPQSRKLRNAHRVPGQLFDAQGVSPSNSCEFQASSS